MSDPELLSGWENALSLPNEYAIRQVEALNRVQERHIGDMDESLLRYVYDYAKERLRGRRDLPGLEEFQPMFYRQTTRVSRTWPTNQHVSILQLSETGGGLQFNGNCGQYGIRIPLYNIVEEIVMPLPPIEANDAWNISLSVDAVTRACAMRRISTGPDLTIVYGDPLPRTLIVVRPD